MKDGSLQAILALRASSGPLLLSRSLNSNDLVGTHFCLEVSPPSVSRAAVHYRPFAEWASEINHRTLDTQ